MASYHWKNRRIGVASGTWSICSLSLSLCNSRLANADVHSTPSSSSSSLPRDGVRVSHYPHKNADYRSHWALKYDQRTRNPKWTYEHLYRSDFIQRESGNHDKADRKKAHFFPDHSIQNEKLKVISKDYSDSHYDRGHMIPAADFKITQRSLNSTFSMANISPQYSSMNRGIWESLESFIRSLITAIEHPYEEVEVISGPVFAPVYSNGKWMYVHNTIGVFPKLITVPSHFFKVILCKRFVPLEHNPDIEIMSKAVAAFLVPNADTKMKDGKSLSSYVIRLDQLESLIGFTLFEDQISVKEKAECDAKIPANKDLKILLSLDSEDKDRWIPMLESTGFGKESSVVAPSKKNTDKDKVVTKFNHLCSVVNCNYCVPKSK